MGFLWPPFNPGKHKGSLITCSSDWFIPSMAKYIYPWLTNTTFKSSGWWINLQNLHWPVKRSCTTNSFFHSLLYRFEKFSPIFNSINHSEQGKTHVLKERDVMNRYLNKWKKGKNCATVKRGVTSLIPETRRRSCSSCPSSYHGYKEWWRFW